VLAVHTIRRLIEAYDESKHSRGKDGKFTSKSGGGSSGKQATPSTAKTGRGSSTKKWAKRAVAGAAVVGTGVGLHQLNKRSKGTLARRRLINKTIRQFQGKKRVKKFDRTLSYGHRAKSQKERLHPGRGYKAQGAIPGIGKFKDPAIQSAQKQTFQDRYHTDPEFRKQAQRDDHQHKRWTDSQGGVLTSSKWGRIPISKKGKKWSKNR